MGASVIGHVGTVSGFDILVPASLGGLNESLNPALAKPVPAFVATRPSALTAGGQWALYSTTEQLSRVATTIDGMILMELHYDVRGVDREDPIMDLILATVTAGLGAYAVKSLVGTLLRKVWGSAVFGELRLTLVRAFARKEVEVGTELVEKMQAAGKRVVVNIGGAGEVVDAINLNPNLTTPRIGIPNHIPVGAEAIGETFARDSIDEIVSNSLGLAPARGLQTRPPRSAISQSTFRSGGEGPVGWESAWQNKRCNRDSSSPSMDVDNALFLATRATQTNALSLLAF